MREDTDREVTEALDAPVIQRIFWCTFEGLVAIALLLGAGDGMAAREVLRWDDVERVTLVDLDPRVTELFRDNGTLAALNGRALNDPKVTMSQ